jgi:hypothetical protein
MWSCLVQVDMFALREKIEELDDYPRGPPAPPGRGSAGSWQARHEELVAGVEGDVAALLPSLQVGGWVSGEDMYIYE